MTDHLASALKLAESGVPVFPVGKDKAPRTPGGFKDASTDPETIKGWGWNGGGMIGAAIQPGVVILDIDPRHGGDATLAALVKANGPLPGTRLVKTGGGGLHYYLAVPEEITLRSSLGPGIDVKRAGKGYVVVPPSQGYTFARGGAIAPAPEWLMAELVVTERDARESAPSDAKYFAAFEDGTTYGLRALEGEMGRLMAQQEGGRNDALNRAAFSLGQLVAGGELSEEKAVTSLELAADRIGLERGESLATIRSGMRGGSAVPRQAPEKAAAEEGNRATSDAPGYGTSAATDPLSEETERNRWVDWNVDEPAPPFYLHPIIPESAYILVYGATEASKSMTFNGLLAEASHHGIRSSVYSLENPPATDRSRLRRLGPDPANFRLTNEPLDLNDPRQLDALVQREKDWGTNVILIDTYSHAFASKSDDGNAKAIDFARRIRWVMHVVGCSVIVVDHTGYQGDEPRDASAKRQQVDVAILMAKAGEWVPGQPSRWRMTNRKAARFANPFHFEGEIRDLEGDRLAIAFRGGGPTWSA